MDKIKSINTDIYAINNSFLDWNQKNVLYIGLQSDCPLGWCVACGTFP
jgi:hypothetical protein